MQGYADMEDLDVFADAYEDIESDESDESDEDLDVLERRQRGRRFRQPPRTAPGGGLFRPRPQSSQYVTQTQLQAAMARVGQQIKTNSDAVKTLNTRVATLSTDVTRQAADLRKEATTRRRETAALRRELRQTREMVGIIPLLSQPRSVQLGADVGNLRADNRVVIDSGDSFSAILPLLLLGGLGSGGGTSGGAEGGSDNNSMLLFALLLGGRR